MRRPRLARLCICGTIFFALLVPFAKQGAAGPTSGTFYWTKPGGALGPDGYGYGSFSWDGTNLSAITTQLGTLAAGSADGSNVVGADGFIYTGRAGSVSQIKPATGQVKTVNSGVNNSVTSIDPGRQFLFVGWKDSALSTLTIGAGFNTGTPHNVTGDDNVASGLAWDNSGTVWYTTGGEDRLGNVGTIAIASFMTTRKLTNISATTITFDPFTGHLFTAGINGITQINPATGAVVSTWLNPQGTGLFIQNLSATGLGHLIAFDSNGLIRIWDFSSGSGLIGGAGTIESSVTTPVQNGGLTLSPIAAFPIITSPLRATAIVDRPFTYQIETKNANAISASNLPVGLSFDDNVSGVTGSPNSPGTFQINLSATNGAVTANATLTLTVQAVSSTGPTIINSSAVTGRTGQRFNFQVYTTGATPAARLSASGLPPGLVVDAITGVISGIATADGSFPVSLTVTDSGQVANAILQMTFTSDPAVPVILSPNSASMVRGQPFTYTINAPSSASASDPTFYALLGALPVGLTFDAATGTISGTISAASARGPTSPNRIDLSGGIISNVQLFASNSHGTGTLPLIFYLAPTGAVNIATRLAVGTANDVLIAGFIITGNAPKKVIIRAIGPSLDFGGTLQDPTLELHDSSGSLGMNDNWRQTQENEIIATTIPPLDQREAAIIAILNPGNYTAIVGGINNTTGIGVVEVYDLGTASLDISSNAKLAQISTRGRVQPGDNVMIGGFIIQGPPSKVIVRAIGPSLSSILPDALSDTVLELHDASGMIVASNDDWRSTQQQEIIDTTVPPSDDRESAIVATLSAGNYTGIVRGKGNATGIGLVEVYSLQ